MPTSSIYHRDLTNTWLSTQQPPPTPNLTLKIQPSAKDMPVEKIAIGSDTYFAKKLDKRVVVYDQNSKRSWLAVPGEYLLLDPYFNPAVMTPMQAEVVLKYRNPKPSKRKKEVLR